MLIRKSQYSLLGSKSAVLDVVVHLAMFGSRPPGPFYTERMLSVSWQGQLAVFLLEKREQITYPASQIPRTLGLEVHTRAQRNYARNLRHRRCQPSFPNTRNTQHGHNSRLTLFGANSAILTQIQPP